MPPTETDITNRHGFELLLRDFRQDVLADPIKRPAVFNATQIYIGKLNSAHIIPPWQHLLNTNIDRYFGG
jgi:hypothetical protein